MAVEYERMQLRISAQPPKNKDGPDSQWKAFSRGAFMGQEAQGVRGCPVPLGVTVVSSVSFGEVRRAVSACGWNTGRD